MMKKTTLNAMNQISHGRDHTERNVPTSQESLIIIILSQNVLSAKFPGSCFDLSRKRKGSIRKKITTETNYFYVIYYYSTYSRRRGSFGYPNQDYIFFYARFY